MRLSDASQLRRLRGSALKAPSLGRAHMLSASVSGQKFVVPDAQRHAFDPFVRQLRDANASFRAGAKHDRSLHRLTWSRFEVDTQLNKAIANVAGATELLPSVAADLATLDSLRTGMKTTSERLSDTAHLLQQTIRDLGV